MHVIDSFDRIRRDMLICVNESVGKVLDTTLYEYVDDVNNVVNEILDNIFDDIFDDIVDDTLGLKKLFKLEVAKESE